MAHATQLYSMHLVRSVLAASLCCLQMYAVCAACSSKPHHQEAMRMVEPSKHPTQLLRVLSGQFVNLARNGLGCAHANAKD